MGPTTIIDVIVITYNSAADVRPCLDSILSSKARPLVVDNGSQDDTLRIVHEEYPQVAITLNPDNGYSRGANLGMSNSTAPVVIISNADVVYPARAIASLAKYISEHTDVGVLGPQQIYPDGSWQRSWGTTPGLAEALLELLGITSLYNAVRRSVWPRRLNRRPISVGYVDGAVMAINRAAYEAVNGFDGSFPFYAEEADFCMRVRKAGWKVISLPTVNVVHRRGASSTKVDTSPTRHVVMMADASEKLICKHYGKRYLSWYLLVKRLFNGEMVRLLSLLFHVAPQHRKAILHEKILIHKAYLGVLSSR